MDEEIINKTENPAMLANDADINGETDSGESDYAEAINALRAEFQARFDRQDNEYKAKIAERDKIINQLLTGSGKTATVPEDKIVDSINEKRKFKKW